MSLGLILAVLWILLSGYFQPLLIGLGALSVILVVVVSRRMDVVDHEGQPVHLTGQVLTYWPWLFWQIIKANVDVAKVIVASVAGSAPVRPVLFRVRTRQQSELAQVVFANSITLTPGTVSLELKDGHVDVHALTAAAAADLMDGPGETPSEMNRRCAEIEERAPAPRTAAAR